MWYSRNDLIITSLLQKNYVLRCLGFSNINFDKTVSKLNLNLTYIG